MFCDDGKFCSFYYPRIDCRRALNKRNTRVHYVNNINPSFVPTFIIFTKKKEICTNQNNLSMTDFQFDECNQRNAVNFQR